ncbi:basic secretory family protein [Antarcticibacterium sp. 1MA-6-2]|uniref:basic secretory family protein n=1 Tax=Antarcticibacterium sp. 1MA-6-2 TaxID=2908210 RepID=UPI001F29D68B|nr:basic secretory family protein [Antarcticibacterium sp. 1MA-6-2]UJH90671.1 basic secretory family protein [Antarcticibacterium sp. 1MA-6-2]
MGKLFFFLLIIISISARSQQQETFKRGDLTLVFINEDPQFKAEVKNDLINTFFAVYPKLVQAFNPEAIKTLEVKIDTSYKEVAYAHNGKITISSEWLRKKPEDIDVITHEVMHIVQSYPNHSGPGWLTEGIADYARHVYGVDNVGAGWSLPAYSSKNHYTQSYRITARFLLWITQQYDKDFVFKLDKHLREKTYDQELWEKYTGKSLDELWAAYQKAPGII